MGNYIGIDMFRNEIDFCLNIDKNISNNEKITLDLILKNEKIRGKYYIVKSVNKTINLLSETSFKKYLLFIKLKTNEFKELMEELKDSIENRIKFIINTRDLEDMSEFFFFKKYIEDNSHKFEIIIKEETVDLNPIKFLIENFEYKDYLEYYVFQGESKKTLSIFHCLDQQNIIKFNGIEKKETKLDHFIYINIGKSSTNLFHYKNEFTQKHIGHIEIGEYTFWGLMKIIDSNIISTNDVINAIDNGNIENCDLIVKDIYGDSYSGINLHQDVVASSLAKLQFLDYNQFHSNDLLKSIIILLSNLFIQKALIHSQILKEKNILISGFISSFPKLMAAIYSTIKVLSENSKNVYFIKSLVNLSCINL